MATRQANVIINVDDKSLTQLNEEIQLLNSEIEQLTIGTEEWVQANKKLGDLKRDFSKVTKEAEGLQGQIEKISGPQQLQAFSKLGAGMVGAFAGVSGTVELLGIQNEEFDKMTAKATTLMSIMGGLNAVAETFSEENIKGLKGIASGFGNMTKAVKGASKAMRAALIATGIGALVVAIGLIVANWEKIKNAIGGAEKAQKRLGEQFRKYAEELSTGYGNINSALEERKRLLEETEAYGQTKKGILEYQEATGEAIEKQNEALRTQFEINKTLLSEAEVASRKAEDKNEDAFKKASRRANLLSITEQHRQNIYTKNINKRQFAVDLTEQQIQLLEIENKNIEIQLTLNESILDINEETRASNLERNKILLDRRNVVENEVKILEVQGNREAEIYRRKKELLEIERDLLGQGVNQTEEQSRRWMGIIAELKALEKVEQLRKEELRNLIYSNKEILRKLKLEQDVTDELSRQIVAYTDQQAGFEERTTILDKQLQIFKRNEDQLKGEKELYDKLLKQRQELSNFDKDGLERFEKMYKVQLESFDKNGEQINEIRNALAEQIGNEEKLEKVYNRKNGLFKAAVDQAAEEIFYTQKIIGAKNEVLRIEKENLALSREGLINDEKRANEELANNAKAQTALENERQEAQHLLDNYQKRLNLEQERVDLQAELDKTIRAEIINREVIEFGLKRGLELTQKDIDYTEELGQKRVDAAEKVRIKEEEVRQVFTNGIISQTELQDSILEKEEEIIDIKNRSGEVTVSNAEKEKEIVGYKKDIVKVEGEIVDKQDEINDNNKEIAETTQDITAELETQSKLYERMQGFLETYAEEVQAVLNVMNAGFNLVAASFDRRAAVAQQNILNLQMEMDDLNSDIDDQEKRRLDILAELEDANGEYYNDLLAELANLEAAEITSADTVKAKQDEINDEIKAEEKKKAQAEYEAAKWRKAQAIIDGIIQTALAVIKALPNIFLSVATGVLGAAGVTTIATQKLPPNPNAGEGYVEGGFTGLGIDSEPAGVVHKNEYVVPSRVVQSPSAKTHIAALERKRVKGYAVGGPVTQGADMSMDYEKFADVIVRAVAAQPPQQVSLVAVSNGIQEVEYTKQQSGLSR